MGTPQSRYNRLLPAKYGDGRLKVTRTKQHKPYKIIGVYTPTAGKSGNPLPSARLVSYSVYPDVPLEDPIWTINAMQYGQIITHDMSLVVGNTQTRKKTKNSEIQIYKVSIFSRTSWN